MKKNSLLVIGLSFIFLIVALIILGDMIGFLKANSIFGQYWPIVLVLIGIIAFSSIPDGSAFAFGLIALGTLLTLKTLGTFESPAGNVIFLVLICLGAIAMLAFSTGKKTNKD